MIQFCLMHGRRWLAFTFLLVPLSLGADEPPRLKKKPRPAEPTTEPAPQPPAKPQPSEPTESAEEPAKLLERIVRNLEAASKRLSDQDAGSKTREHQAEALRAIDELLKPPQNPNSSSSSPPPMGPPDSSPSGNGSSSRSSGSSSTDGTRSKGSSRREKRLQQTGNGSPTSRPMSQPGSTRDPQTSKQSNQEKSVNTDPKTAPKTGLKEGDLNRIADVYKDVWGHLPETMRREMDQYYREQFMPRYSDLLRQYYSTIAEKNRRGGR